MRLGMTPVEVLDTLNGWSHHKIAVAQDTLFLSRVFERMETEGMTMREAIAKTHEVMPRYWTPVEMPHPDMQFFGISTDKLSRAPTKVAVLKAFFEGGEADLPYLVRRESDEFDYGYALTVHKAQGSQWDDVIVFDESRAFREHRARWLYTGVTRASRRLTIVR